MGDSDEEYDRRRRDKFRGERNDYDNRKPTPNRYDRGRGERMPGGGRPNNWERKRDYYQTKDQGGRDRRDDFGRGSSPPSKRTKRDWENSDHTWRASVDSNALVSSDKNTPGVPSLMTFKDFVIQQEDSINEVESVRRYQEYKVEFKRTQINDFFVLHKGEEWFEEKYHPLKSVKRKKVVRGGLRKRLRVFLDLWEEGYIDNVSLNFTTSDVVLKLLDRVIMKLEGASDEEVKALDLPPPVEEKKPEVKEETEAGKEEKPKEEVKEEEKEPLPPGMEDEDEPLPPGMEDDEEEKVKKEEEEDKTEESKANVKKEGEESKMETEEIKYTYDGARMKHALSVFMRSIPANVTRDDLIGVCKRYPGFLRVAMSEPASERRYSRRAWATFEHDVNIKDINWSMTNIRIKDVEFGPVVNRDVTNRIRAVNGVTCSPMTMQLDIKFALKLLKKLDEKHQLYVEEETNGHVEEKKEEEKEADEEGEDGETKENEKEKEKEKEKEEVEDKPLEVLNIPDSNPVLEKLPSHLCDVVAGLEMEGKEDVNVEYPVVVNDELRKWLDLVLLYLRVVHCIDFYNANEYVHEDEMPMRCGIMHVRSAPLEVASKKDVHEWCNQIESKLEHILANEEKTTTDEEAEKLGKKNEETEVENFIKANTQELAKDKWLCPLSGKKFRGPDFIRKHIMIKHLDSVDNVKTEVQFFNNYVYDTKRPCFPDAKPRTGTGSTHSSTAGTSSADGRTWTSSSRQPVFATPRPAYGASAYQPSTPQSAPLPETYGRVNTFPPKGIKRGGYRDRKLIKYRDLDAPEESDFF